MPNIIKRPDAENDLDEIWWYIAQDNPQNADKFFDRIEERCLALAEFPKMGIGRDDLVQGMRSQSVGNYLLFYFPIEDGIDLVRVLHGSRDVEKLF